MHMYMLLQKMSTWADNGVFVDDGFVYLHKGEGGNLMTQKLNRSFKWTQAFFFSMVVF